MRLRLFAKIITMGFPILAVCTRAADCRRLGRWSQLHCTASVGWLLLALGFLGSGGCGKAPPPSNPPAAIQSSPSGSASTGAAPNADETAPASPIGDGVGSTVNAEVADSNFDSEQISALANTQSTQAVPATEEPKEKTKLNPRQKVPEPSVQQLAQWAQPEFEALQLLSCRESSETGLINHLAHTPDGRHFITAGSKVVLWSVDSDVPVHVFLELSDNQTVESLSVSPNGKWFAAGDSEGTLRMWSIADHKEVNAKPLYSNDIIQIAISPNGQELATITHLDEITVWGAQQLQQLNRFKVDTNSLTRIEYMTNDLLVAAGETTTCWNVRTGKLEKTLSPGRYNFTMARSPDGSHFLFGDEEALQLWRTSDQQPQSSLNGGFASKEHIAFSGDGKHLVTANGSSIRLWEIASGQLVQIVDTFGWPITGMTWLPETKLLVVTSLNSRTRIWGTAKDGQAFGLQPMHVAAMMPDPESREPATPNQLLQAMDLRTFPRLPGSSVSANSDFNTLYETAESIDVAKLFYRYQLGKAGWSEVVPDTASPHLIRFQKDGFMLTASFYDGSQLKTMVSLSFGGNYDLRWIPRLDSAPIEMVYENEDTVMYRTKADVIQIETTLLRKLFDGGWTSYSRLFSAHAEEEDVRHLTFLRHGMTLNVSISRDPTDPTRFNVQCGGNLMTNSIPVPQDSGYVEFDGSTQPCLVATTGMNLANAREFYDQQLAAQGWLVRDFGRSVKDEEQNWLSYIRGQQDLTVGLQRLPTGRTLVRIGDDLERSSWQLAKPTAPPATEIVAEGIEAVDFPILNETKTAKYDAIDKSLEFSMDSTPLLKVGELYTQQLQSMEWKTEGSGIRADDYVFITFAKGKVEIDLRARVTDGKSMVNIQGDGILWNKPLPGGKRVISYETWLKVNHHPATLDLLDKYEAEMR